MEQAVLAQVEQLAGAHARAPKPGEKVHKEECGFTFDTPESEGGLYLNLTSMQAFASDFVQLDHQRTGQRLYLHTKWTSRPRDATDPAGNGERETPSRLGINVDSGFNPDSAYEVLASHSLVLMPEMTLLHLPRSDLPASLQSCIDAVLSASDASSELSALSSQWEEERKPSKYASSLPQEPSPRPVPPDSSQWRCDESNESTNLWLNLSDGFIGSGRPQPDGSGGNGAALRHFYKRWREEGKFYPLVVKLGTITPYGADVFSYAEDEDDMVEDPHLAEHLAHFGIDIMRMSKTEKSMAELQIDMNMRVEFDAITEAGQGLKPLSGAGYIGMKNLGNTCYLNSVMQVIKELPEFSNRYVSNVDSIFTLAPRDLASDYPTQMAKLLYCLLSDRYKNSGSKDFCTYQFEQDYEQQGATTESCIQPRKFKELICGDHLEFRTSRQQDASAFFQYLLQKVERQELSQKERLGERYRQSEKENVLPLPIPLDKAENREEVAAYEEREQKRQRTELEKGTNENDSEPVRPRVRFETCLFEFAKAAPIEDVYSPASQRKTTFYKTTRFLNFPKYLVVQAWRFYVAQDWTARKMDVELEVPDEIHLESYLRAGERSEAEEPLPEDEEDKQAENGPSIEPDVTIVSQLTAMGFNENGCKKAAIAVNNGSVEEAAEWVFAHMEEEGFSDPPGQERQGGKPDADPENVSMMTAMGFTEYQAQAALKECSGDIERAADWLFSRAENLDEECAKVMGNTNRAQVGSNSSGNAELSDGYGSYELFAFVSHMGANTSCGHYVCHIKKEGRWCLYNDRKVAESASPPRARAYLYFFRRKDAQ